MNIGDRDKIYNKFISFWFSFRPFLMEISFTTAITICLDIPFFSRSGSKGNRFYKWSTVASDPSLEK
jgi:hypothetical protein